MGMVDENGGTDRGPLLSLLLVPRLELGCDLPGGWWWCMCRVGMEMDRIGKQRVMKPPAGLCEFVEGTSVLARGSESRR